MSATPTTPRTTGGAGTITTVVGTGVGGDGSAVGAALESELGVPIEIAFDDDGNMYIAERYGVLIKKVDTAGELSIVAGNGETGSSCAEGVATQLPLGGAMGLAVGPDGILYVADTVNHCIRAIDAAGVMTTIAGTGRAGFAGDGGPAVQARLNEPAGMVLDRRGVLFVADLGNFAIRRIDRGGTIDTIVGVGGETGRPKDGTPATMEGLGSYGDHFPLGLAIAPGGDLLVTDMGNWRVWRLDDRGTLHALAGNGILDYSGDGGPATKAGISYPLDVAVGEDGEIYISTHDHGVEGDRIRMVDTEGVITTIAGTGKGDYTGDGGPATDATLNIPSGIAIGPDGNLYIADAVNSVIRMVEL